MGNLIETLEGIQAIWDASYLSGLSVEDLTGIGYEWLAAVAAVLVVVFGIRGYKKHKLRGEVMRKQERELMVFLSDKITDALDEARMSGLLTVRGKREWNMKLGRSLSLRDLIYPPSQIAVKSTIKYRLFGGGFDWTPMKLSDPQDVVTALASLQKKLRTSA